MIDFHFTGELIASDPLEKDASKLLMVNRKTGEFQDRHFHLYYRNARARRCPPVMNDTRVLPARLPHGQRRNRGPCWTLAFEIQQGDEWEVLAKPAKCLKVGTRVISWWWSTMQSWLRNLQVVLSVLSMRIFLEVLESLRNAFVSLYSMKITNVTLPDNLMPRRVDQQQPQLQGHIYLQRITSKIQQSAMFIYSTLTFKNVLDSGPLDLFQIILDELMRCTFRVFTQLVRERSGATLRCVTEKWWCSAAVGTTSAGARKRTKTSRA